MTENQKPKACMILSHFEDKELEKKTIDEFIKEFDKQKYNPLIENINGLVRVSIYDTK